MVGGTAGQVVIFDLNMEGDPKEETLNVVKADLVTEKEGFIWKGHTMLTIKNNEVKIPLGFQPSSVLQISPPASINSIGRLSRMPLGEREFGIMRFYRRMTCY